ncbi:MAG: GlsB/YeaQ/YmgE family stress response membrane protein [Methylococcaceae bacterium]
MDITVLLIFLAIGAIAGWLAGTLMKGGGFGLLGNIIVGILGAIVGGYVFGMLGIAAGGGLIGSIITATVGAALFLFIVKLIKKA